ncbi:MAG: iron-containing alcohol dehydrogenase [Aeromicrobium sp.]
MDGSEQVRPAAAFSLTLRGPRVVFGEGVARRMLSSELDTIGAARVMVVASARELAVRQELLDGLADRIVGVFTEARRHVPLATAEAARRRASELGADCLVSVGGGSAVGTAKAVALESGLPIVSVPTTYAGSDFTPVYGITDGAVKRTGRSDTVLPRIVLLDPTLAFDLPLDITLPSAGNALAHCVSAVFAGGRSPLTDLMATEGARLLAAGLLGVGETGLQRRARSDLAQGAHMAGTVLAHAGGSAHHTICHVLGGAFDLPHAQTHSAILPSSARYLQELDPGAARRLAVALGRDDGDLATSLSATFSEAGAAVRLRDLGIGRTELDTAAGLLAGEGGVAGLGRPRAVELLESAW